jgi:hypothetical protein
MKQKMLLFLAGLTMFIASPVSVAFAEESVPTNSVTAIAETNATTEGERTSFDYSPDGELPSVSMQEANDWADEKGQDATSFLQVIGQWFSIIIFIICAVLSLIGAIGGRASKGVVGMLIAIVMYAGITYAPALIQFFSTWLAS